MNAIPKLSPITARATTPPKYDNRAVDFAGAWVNENIEALRAYYTELGRHLPTEGDDTVLMDGDTHRFGHFCKAEWDRARGRF